MKSCTELSNLGDASLRESPRNVVIRVAGSASALGPLVGNGGACPAARARPRQVFALVASGKLSIDARNVTITAGRVGGQCGVLVIQRLSSRTILLEPLNATLYRRQRPLVLGNTSLREAP